MNKYKKFSRQARKENKRLKMCGAKKAYDTAEEATATGNEIYECPHCNKFHTTGSFRKLVSKVAYCHTQT